ncbi:glyceraldehyde 3-phosphate dehydrogenase [Crossiella equi]|uniref:Glyceraldehyde 3-phosphate dehydrogenase n=1 Tax=Crossiella equi TaxID=130796 RepID=A0ABS5A5F9_9PSEU|nr:type I glyceraldehyde-3-phosphate dehydrogenase [Crossiella equi]MBP2471824.1 glyceraldehyde 3-phosphate dehydrogenase [Crossiella equi]
MVIRVGVNGLGRIGRAVVRALAERTDTALTVVAVNDLTTPEALAHLLAHDSTYGPWPGQVTARDNGLVLNGQTVRVSAEHDPARLDWDVDLVIEATGRFRTREAAADHLVSGARKVVITAPGKDVDATIVLGVNEHTYDPDRHHVVSNASCTTNCVAPMALVLHQTFGIREGLMTTIHSYTNDQSLLDSPHRDPRRARSAAVNVIPTSTGAAKAVGLVLPQLAGRLDGLAVRVPVEDGSLTDLTVVLERPASAEEVNRAFTEAAEGRLKDVLRCSTAPLVSRDIIGDPASCVVDLGLTKVSGNTVKVFGWYDNEWGYANRTIDLALLMAAHLRQV